MPYAALTITRQRKGQEMKLRYWGTIMHHYPLIGSVPIVAFLIGTLGMAACGQTTTSGVGTNATPHVPITQVTPPRMDASMVYDSKHGVIVLRGGVAFDAPATLLNDSWTWDGKTWTPGPSITSPPKSGLIVFDAARQQMVLLASTITGLTVENETWTADENGTHWTQQHPTTIPQIFQASMVYDAAHQQVLLFGGDNPSGPAGNIDDYQNATWTWDGTNWTQQHPAIAPAPRVNASMIYDAARQQVVLYSGHGMRQYGDLWLWDGATWQQEQPATMPPERQNAFFLYDDALQQDVLFGGTEAFQTFDDTWLWNGTNWRQQGNGAPIYGFQVAAYDVAQNQIVVYVGIGKQKQVPPPKTAAPTPTPNPPPPEGPASQTWVWDGQRWSMVA